MRLAGELRNENQSLEDELSRLKGGKGKSKFTLKMAKKKVCANRDKEKGHKKAKKKRTKIK
jgi:hypothetical protein